MLFTFGSFQDVNLISQIFCHGCVAISKIDTFQKVVYHEQAQIPSFLYVNVGYMSELLKNFTLLLSSRIFQKLHGIALMLSFLKMNTDFQTEQKILVVQHVIKVFVQLCQQPPERRIL